MPRRSPRSRPELSGSWATVEEEEEEEKTASPDSSDSTDRDSDDPHCKSSVASLNRSTISSRKTPAMCAYQPPARSTKNTPTRQLASRNGQPSPLRQSAEPQLVMPSPGQEHVADSIAESTAFLRSTPSGRRLNRKNSSGSQSPKADLRRSSENSEKQGNSRSTSSRSQSSSVVRQYGLWRNIISPTFGYISPMLSDAMAWLRPFFSLIIALLVLATLWRVITTKAAVALSICRIPGVPMLFYLFNLPVCRTLQPRAPVEFDQLMAVQSTFEDVLSSSANAASLPLDMKHSEASIRDLKHVIRYSSLPSRNEMVFELNGFVDTARQASSDLTRFNSRIGRAVDHILTTNHWTLQVIDNIAEKEAIQGSVSRVLDKINPFTVSTVSKSEKALLSQYVSHSRAVEEKIAELIVEAQAMLAILDNLDSRLDVISIIATRDGVTVKGNRDELLTSLWVKLGGKRSSVGKLEEQLALLRQVGAYRKLAWAHVTATILKLQSIAAGLEDLRERVSAPEVVGIRADVPLSMHIENIQRGVERLEEQRENARQVENKNYRTVLDRAGGDLIDA